MGQKRNRRRGFENSDLRYRDRAASSSRTTGGPSVERGQVRPGDTFPPQRPGGTKSRYQSAAVCGLLLLAVALVFGQTLRHEFVNYDDGKYVFENPHVCRGLTASGITWAFTDRHAANWVPLTWVSFMLDYQLYGLNAGGWHLTNMLLHAANAVLIFFVLRRMTGCFWSSAFVAATFTVHPLRVESVAW